ncbi:uncharacterized protein MONOS_7088 [Monocercomonoides exilis]|uniref:uncharacterized protein n=1 Tax=Monocercomonoides exilis TaxID=2049356 RepID=UPI00355AB47A|nr:hypothetical protein MONOS_7088 [Monocercomonoides exilis]|eukprot:MONOS_7088.1-p1 / transcript=MONOS_7088.1 / gene=MONOS_7088 / organism=Monocercomonoides_exilis_PA203 / gene_product=unspecified product / transcript_product=unspecified product / location=Mono_scaffold00235:27156-27607(+) / protein_length=132 / sequence_SO=supercontig / SO=protein_coding / is_pseudo=false
MAALGGKMGCFQVSCFGDILCMRLGEKHAVQKKSEAALCAMNVPEEFPGCELYDFLYCNTVLFEGDQQQLWMKEKEDFLTMSLRMCRMCINIVLEGELGKKIKLFLGELEEIKSDNGEAEAYVFLGLLLNF